MPYQISLQDKNALGASLAAYYEDAVDQGYKDIFNKIARANMGIVTGYLDQASDTYTSIRAKSKDKFLATFRSTLKQQVSVYLANKNDVAGVLTQVAEKALTTLAGHIPIPMLGTIVAKGISFASGKAQEELHNRSITEADGMLSAKTGNESAKLWSTDVEAAALATKAMDQYKIVCNYIKTLPTSINTFDDAVSFPSGVFRVQAAASSLNVALNNIHWYISAMQERVTEIATVVNGYKKTIRNDMPGAVDAVLQKAYGDAHAQGKLDISRNKYSAPPSPTFQRPSQTGGATQLGAFMANAVAQGYYDAGNTGPQIGRPRAMAGAPPPLPPKPNFMKR